MDEQRQAPEGGISGFESPQAEKTKATAEEPKTPTRPRLPLVDSPLQDLSPHEVTGSTPQLTSKVRQKLDPVVFNMFIKPLDVTDRQSKRNFSEVSQATDQSIQAAKISKTSEEYSEEFDQLVFAEVSKKIKAKIKACQDECKLADEYVRVLNSEYHRGLLDISKDDYDKNLDTLEKLRARNLVQLAVLRNQRRQIVGEYLDYMERSERQEANDWAYIDLLITRNTEPKGAKLTLFQNGRPKEQERFRSRVLKEYDAEDSAIGDFWCCIEGEMQISKVAAAHLVPYNIGENNAAYLFGQSEDQNGHLMSPQNGVPIRKEYEELLDKAEIAFVPGEGTNDIKIVVLNWKREALIRRLHGRILSFRNDFRPRKRYLYFAFAMALLRRQRHSVSGWWRGFADHGLQEIWASPGEYLRKSTLLCLARRVGHLEHGEAEYFTTGKEGEVEEQARDDAVSDEISLATEVNRRLSTIDPFSGGGTQGGLMNRFQLLSADDDEDEDEDEDDEGENEGED